jgi:hypothetical protein
MREIDQIMLQMFSPDKREVCDMRSNDTKRKIQSQKWHWTICVPVFMLLLFVCVVTNAVYRNTIHRGEDYVRVWWLAKECKNVSYLFFQSDEIYEFDATVDWYRDFAERKKLYYKEIDGFPIKIIRYTALLPQNRNKFLSEISLHAMDDQVNTSCFRFVRRGYYSLCERENGNVLYFVYDQDISRVFCYVNLGGDGIRISSTDSSTVFEKDDKDYLTVLVQEF